MADRMRRQDIVKTVIPDQAGRNEQMYWQIPEFTEMVKALSPGTSKESSVGMNFVELVPSMETSQEPSMISMSSGAPVVKR